MDGTSYFIVRATKVYRKKSCKEFIGQKIGLKKIVVISIFPMQWRRTLLQRFIISFVS